MIEAKLKTVTDYVTVKGETFTAPATGHYEILVYDTCKLGHLYQRHVHTYLNAGDVVDKKYIDSINIIYSEGPLTTTGYSFRYLPKAHGSPLWKVMNG